MIRRKNLHASGSSSSVICRYVGSSGISFVAVQDLPDVMLMQIFSQMTLRELCQMALVCKRWMILAYDSALWQFVDMSKFRHIGKDTTVHLIHSRFSPSLRSLNLSNCDVSTEILHELSLNCRRLQTLKLSNCAWDLQCFLQVLFPESLTYFDARDFGNSYSLLTHLIKGLVLNHVKYFGFGNCLSCREGFGIFKEHMLTLSNLSVLEISDSDDVDDIFLLELSENVSHLRGMSFRRCPLLTGQTLYLVLENLLDLETLSLISTGISDMYLSMVPWEKYEIQELDLSFNSDITPSALAIILPKMTGLKYISLNNCGRGQAFDSTVVDAITRSNSWRSLETLSLQFCKKLLGHELRSLLSGSKLKHLSLRSSHNVSLANLSQVIHLLPLLEKLEAGALFSRDEHGRDWDQLIIQLGKFCRFLQKLTLVKCSCIVARGKMRQLKASVRFFLTKCTKLSFICVLYSDSVVSELFASVSHTIKNSGQKLKISAVMSEEVIPPTTNSLDAYLQRLYFQP